MAIPQVISALTDSLCFICFVLFCFLWNFILTVSGANDLLVISSMQAR